MKSFSFISIYFPLSLPLSLDIGFHFNRREVYCSLSNGTIQRFSVSVNVNTMTGSITVMSTSGLETVLTSSNITNIAIDWVSDIGYFLQKSDGQSQVLCLSVCLSVCLSACACLCVLCINV